VTGSNSGVTTTERRKRGERAARSRTFLGVWLVAVACTPEPNRVHSAAPPAAIPLSMPGPSPTGRDAATASALNARCIGCHSEIAAEWRGSFHAQAQRDPAYQRAFAIEPLPFCQGCHAPETAANRPVPEAAADLGVGCVTCHVVGEHLLASSAGTSTPPHAVTRSVTSSRFQISRPAQS
jgi:hypothetical protein